MLWQKESTCDGAMYVDILKNTKLALGKFPLYRKMKNNAQSYRRRIEGDRKYTQNDIVGAMDMYNESICLAEKGSEDLGLAYANRSSCFIKLQLYEQCVVDIELAKAANYPQRLMSRLDDRLRKCLSKESSGVANEPTEPTLSFGAHEKWPCMADVLEIQRNDQFGRMIIAKSDIQIGDIILIEEAYIQMLYGTERNRCYNCLKQKMNFIPCDNCSDIMYCSEKCANNNYHKSECDMTVGTERSLDGNTLQFVLRSVVIAINTFSTTAELMEFVEKCRESDLLDTTSPADTPIAKYRMFYKLAKTLTKEHISKSLECAYYTFHAIMGSTLGEKFETTASQRFLMHLAIDHYIIIGTNRFGGCTDPSNRAFGQKIDKSQKQRQEEIFLLMSYFNHSCMPNVMKLLRNNVTVCMVLRPIKKGEQLFVAYSNDDAYDLTEKQRNDYLQCVYGFRCKCEYCRKGTGKQKGVPHLQMDEDFGYVCSNVSHLIQQFDMDLLRNIKDHCVKFVERYPIQSLASREGAYILTNLWALSQKELNDS